MSGFDFSAPEELVAHFNGSNNLGDCNFVSITIVDDLGLEDDEDLFIELIMTETAIFLTQSTTSILIIDNDREYWPDFHLPQPCTAANRNF